MIVPQILVTASAAVVGLLGALHLVYTVASPKFDPRDATLRTAMEKTSPRISPQTTMWRCWVGFNASHSLGALLFAAVFGYLAVARFEVLANDPVLLGIGFVTLTAYEVLAAKYWFIIPLIGIALAQSLFVAGAAWTLLGL